MREKPKDYSEFIGMARRLRVPTMDLGEGLEERVLRRIRRESLPPVADRFAWLLMGAYGSATAVVSAVALVWAPRFNGVYSGLLSLFQGGLPVYGG